MSERIQRAREALKAERAADEAVDKVLGDLAELDEDAVERVLGRLVGLLQGGRGNGAARPAQPAPAASYDVLPDAVQSGAKELKRLSGLPDAAVAERVSGWIEVCGEDAVAEAFAAMTAERPPHEISFVESRLGLGSG